ncbi:enolase C-terminal domain-like protein [Nannocystis bainbridge]|uniref:Enolase C-terminal domain-like protein n=1 Tax=Nannocystis bainbridge TaxID=2995303 RepID=A0ABT5E0H3_9BACT|nr:enolase C-terminal domain-like protein [Nannocystis bainbridge]MDC0719380.1 enolase C-terminal domain-like protein [Nannocystis bainbridge]
MDLRAALVTLRLRHPFGLSRGTVSELPSLLVRLDPEGPGCRLPEGPDRRGLGEASPVRYLGQSAAAAAPLAAAIAAELAPAILLDPRAIAAAGARMRELAPDHSAARCAVDTALWDAAARAADRPLPDLLADPDVLDRAGLERHVLSATSGATVTSYTIALDELDAMAARAAAAAHLPVLKIKLGKGRDFDRAALRAVAAAAPRARLRIDANGGWTADDVRALLPLLVDLGVEQLEQPLPAGRPDLLAALARDIPLPIYADEDVQGPGDVAALRGRVAGINVKLMKCGGISPALATIAAAREAGLRVLVGCMIETRVGLAAGAALARLADEADLDAHMLTRDDPMPPGSQVRLAPELPRLCGPGLGVPPGALPTDGDLGPARVA